MRRILKPSKARAREDDRDRKQYQQQYYQEHRDDLSVRRKQRYQEDPAYREAILRQVREYRQSKRAERERLRAEGKLPPPRTGGPRAPLRVEVNGVSTVAYTVSHVATQIQRSKHTINYWTRIGLLPRTPFCSARGDRLYTEGQIFVMRMAISKRMRVRAGDREFLREIQHGWDALGITAVDKHAEV